MLVEFRAGNILSFDEQQSIRTATPSIGIGTSYGECSRTITILGPNSSGKSNLVRTVGIARDLALNRRVNTRGLRYGEYRGMAHRGNSHLEFVVRTGEDTLAYGIEADLGTGAIAEEWLYRISPDGDIPVYEIGSDHPATSGRRTALADMAADGSNPRGCGLALVNVLMRIKFFFGGDSGIHIESKLGLGTRATVCLVGEPRELEPAAPLALA